MSRVLIIAEHDGRSLSAGAAKCVSCAREIGTDAIDIAVLAAPDDAVARQAAALDGVARVLNVVNAQAPAPVAAMLAPLAAEAAEGYTHVLGPSSTFGKDLMPRVAALLGVGQLSDVMAAESAYRFRRPVYAGNAVVTVEASPERTLVATVRTASYSEAPTAPSPAEVETLQLDVALPAHTRFVALESERGERPDLQTAPRVVAGGRALGSKEGFRRVEELADVLGAALGASRAAVDAGYVPNDMQIGQTGKIIAPDLYIAVGISGAIQHLTGIKDAGTIVAINKDADAPIFEAADIGLVADLFEAVPELVRRLR